jgi:hypothetical protein
VFKRQGEGEFFGKTSTAVPPNIEDQNNKIHLYPNPSDGIVHFDQSEKIEKVEVTNINGVVLYNLTVVNQFEINLNESPGLYIFTLYLTDGTIENHKIIID